MCNVHGCYLQTIDSFLMNRTVSLLLNGFVGPVRKCLDFGLPQGSALSPTLFRFYLYDLEAVCHMYSQVTFFKFADDGSVKVSCDSLEECIHYMNLVLGAIADWTSQWRMVVNCDKNKTELICFYTNTPHLLPSSFTLGKNSVLVTDHSKVLGVVIDKDLNFKEHSKAVYNKLIFRWISMCRYSNRNWGMNQEVIMRIAKTIIFSCMFYAGMVWFTNQNISELKGLWYRLAKSAVGAVFNVDINTLEVIVGVPPLEVQNRIITLKHYLKTITEKPNQYVDIYVEFLNSEINSSNPVVLCQIRDVFKFMCWKHANYPDQFSHQDVNIIQQRSLDQFSLLSKMGCWYTKGMIGKFTELIWQESLNNKMLLDGCSRIPVVSLQPLHLPWHTNRKDEVLLISLLYNNNLLNGFLHRYDSIRFPSPLCLCSEEEQTGYHLLTSCPLVHGDTRESILYLLGLKDRLDNKEFLSDNVSLLNSSRDPQFIHLGLEAIQSAPLNLRTKINLQKKK